MPSENKDKYSIWLALTETDYVTMFIKTWFTFLATLHEMLPNSSGGIGDGKIINSYKEKIFDEIQMNIDEEFIKNVLKAYHIGRTEALRSDEFLKDYFETYYKLNDSYSREFNYRYKGKQTSLLLRMCKNGKKDYKLEVKLLDERKKFKDYFGNKIETELNFSIETVASENRMFENKGEFINTIIKSVVDKAGNVVNSKSTLDERGKTKRLNFLKDECINDMKRQLNDELDLKQIFNLSPDNKIETLNPETLEIEDKPKSFDEDITKWFIDFSYKLRNILFHFIIDPLDKNWQELFKYSYLALKHLSEQNINYLNSSNSEGASNDNRNS